MLPGKFYEQQIGIHKARLALLRRKLLWASLLRLLSFGFTVHSFYLVVTSSATYSFLYFIASLIIFILLIRFFSGYRDQKKFVEQLLFINTNERTIASNGRNAFPNGEKQSQKSGYADDLDIFGEGSLFHFMNRTTTPHGEKRLSRLLNEPLNSCSLIREYQNALHALSVQPEMMQQIVAQGLTAGPDTANIGEVQRWIASESRVSKNSFVQVMRFILPVFNVAALLYYLDSDNPVPIGIGILFSWLLIGKYSPYINGQHVTIGRKQAVLEQYAGILNRYAACNPGDASILQKLQQTSRQGCLAIKRLSKLSSLFDQRLNLLVNIFLNSLFVYDLQCIVSLEKWKAAHKNEFGTWIEAVGEIEMLVSLGTFTFNHPHFCFPEVIDGHPFIEAVTLAHPLIPTEEAIANNLVAGKHEKLMLITGSNMSGKSTFLRTVGVNVLLAQCGAPVCAVKFTCTPMQIFSSIRISDSLQEHTSFFMAELKKLKSIIDVLDSGTPALVLIDEVLRGTNSDDKTHGSDALIKKLTSYNALTLFATHDLSLSRLEVELPELVSNYCFESRIENGELLFDYKLRRGVAKNRNATFLMEKMGIIS